MAWSGGGGSGGPGGWPCFFSSVMADKLGARAESIAVHAAPHHAVGGGLGSSAASPSTSSLASNLETVESSSAGHSAEREQLEDQMGANLENDRLVVYVGSSDGTLFVYDSKPVLTGGSWSLSLHLRSTYKRFNPSKYGVSQLCVVDKWGMLLSVLDGHLFAHSLYELSGVSGGSASGTLTSSSGASGGNGQLQRELAAKHNQPFDCIVRESGSEKDAIVSAYAVNADNDALCVVCRRCIFILRHKKPAAFSIVQRIATSETGATVRWAGNDHVCVGFSKDYVFYKVHSGVEVKRPRMRTGVRKHPIMCGFRHRGEHQLLLCKDNQGFFLEDSGVPARNRCITWSEQPTAVFSCPPYIVALLSRRIEVHLAITCELLQSIALPGQIMLASNAGDGPNVYSGGIAPWHHVEKISGASGSVGSSGGQRNVSFGYATMRRAVVLVANQNSMHLLSLAPLPQILEDVLSGNVSGPLKGAGFAGGGNGASSALKEDAAFPNEASFQLAKDMCRAVGENVSSENKQWVQPTVGVGVSPEELELVQASVHARLALFYFTDASPRLDCDAALKALHVAQTEGRLSLEFVMMMFKRTDLFDSETDATTLSLNLADLRSELSVLYLHALQSFPEKSESGNDAKAAVLREAGRRLALDFESDEIVPPVLVEDVEGLSYLEGSNLSSVLLLVFLPYVLQVRLDLLALVDPEAFPSFTASPPPPPSNGNPSSLADAGSQQQQQLRLNIKSTVHEILGIVDTALLRSFVLASNQHTEKSVGLRAKWAHMMEEKMAFLRGENWCDVRDCEKLLSLYPEMWEELLWLYYGKGMHENALEWLFKLETNKSEARDVSQINSPYAAKSIEYLRNLGRANQDLVLRYSTWVVQHCRVEDSNLIFIPPDFNQSAKDDVGNTGNNSSKGSPGKHWGHSPSPGLDDSADYRSEEEEEEEEEEGNGKEGTWLNHQVVVAHLEELDRQACDKAVEQKRALPPPLATRFLLFVAQHFMPRDRRLADELAALYIRTLGYWREGATKVANASHSSVGHVEDNLLAFLENNKHYDAGQLAQMLSTSKLYEEYALVLSRLGRHAQACRIYVDSIGSVAKAEDYCAKVYEENHPERSQVFLLLFEILIEKQMLDQALAIARAHVKCINPQDVLDQLPGDLTLEIVRPFLEATLCERSSKAHGSQIIKQLVRKEHLEMKQALFTFQKKNAIVTRKTVCTNTGCQRPILADQAFARLADGSLVHYACLNK